MLRPVDGTQRVSVGLELEVRAGAMRGELKTASGEAREFSGWLSLLAALEELSATGQLATSSDMSAGGEEKP
jgi:hypothetical protein